MSATDHDDPSANGPRTGPYELRERLGVGGMAETFVAVRRGPAGFEQRVCLKRVLPEYAEDRDFLRLFADEARLAAHLSHNNIVRALDFGEDDGAYYMALELVEGADLSRMLRVRRDAGTPGLTEDEASYVGAELARALDYAHHLEVDGTPAKIIHRDVSPANVLVSSRGEVKLTDFGIAKATTQYHVTHTGVVKGKLPYMSPEQASGEALDARSDLFSLGVLFYEILTGSRPFDATSEFQTLLNIVEGRRKPLEASPAWVAIVDRLLTRRPDDRFPTARAVLDAIGAVRHAEAVRRSLAELATEARRPRETIVAVSAPPPRPPSPPTVTVPARRSPSSLPPSETVPATRASSDPLPESEPARVSGYGIESWSSARHRAGLGQLAVYHRTGDPSALQEAAERLAPPAGRAEDGDLRTARLLLRGWSGVLSAAARWLDVKALRPSFEEAVALVPLLVDTAIGPAWVEALAGVDGLTRAMRDAARTGPALTHRGPLALAHRVWAARSEVAELRALRDAVAVGFAEAEPGPTTRAVLAPPEDPTTGRTSGPTADANDAVTTLLPLLLKDRAGAAETAMRYGAASSRWSQLGVPASHAEALASLGVERAAARTPTLRALWSACGGDLLHLAARSSASDPRVATLRRVGELRRAVSMRAAWAARAPSLSDFALALLAKDAMLERTVRAHLDPMRLAVELEVEALLHGPSPRREARAALLSRLIERAAQS